MPNHTLEEIHEKLKELSRLAEWDSLPKAFCKDLKLDNSRGINVGLKYDADTLLFAFEVRNCYDYYDSVHHCIEKVFEASEAEAEAIVFERKEENDRSIDIDNVDKYLKEQEEVAEQELAQAHKEPSL